MVGQSDGDDAADTHGATRGAHANVQLIQKQRRRHPPRQRHEQAAVQREQTNVMGREGPTGGGPFVGGKDGVADDQIVFFEFRDQDGKGSHHQYL